MKLCYVSTELRTLAPIEAPDWWESSCYTLDEVLTKISALGLRDIELCPPHIKLGMSAKEIGRVKESLKTHNIRIACVDSDAFRWSVNNSDLKQAFMFVRLAHKLEASVVRMFSGPEKSAKRRRAMEFLAKSAKHAEKHGVKLAVENIWDHHFGRIRAMKEGVEEIGSENLKALVDVTNFHVAGENPVEAPSTLTNLITHMHVRDAIKIGDRWEWKILGTGGDLSRTSTYPKLIEELKKQDYQGCLSIEPLIFPAAEALEKSTQFLYPLIG